MNVRHLASAIVLLLALAACKEEKLDPPPPEVVQCHKDCTVSRDGLALIRTFEGYSPFVYEDAAGKPTIGFGHLVRKGETFPQPLLPDAAEELLHSDAQEAVRGVNRHTAVALWQAQFDALVSFTFNLGVGAYEDSTLRRRVNTGRHKEVPDQFRRWVFAGGKKLRGLVLRREAEATMYQSAGS